MGQIIDGKKLADEIKDKVAKQIFDLKKYNLEYTIQHLKRC